MLAPSDPSSLAQVRSADGAERGGRHCHLHAGATVRPLCCDNLRDGHARPRRPPHAQHPHPRRPGRLHHLQPLWRAHHVCQRVHRGPPLGRRDHARGTGRPAGPLSGACGWLQRSCSVLRVLPDCNVFVCVSGYLFVCFTDQCVLPRFARRPAHPPPQVHFHFANSVAGRASVKDVAVHDVFQRCYTVHHTHDLVLARNVGFNTFGHCFFLEGPLPLF